MPPSTSGLTVEELLEHTHWVRELAQRLVRDVHAAEDLAQDTVLAALHSRPATGVSVRQWLGCVLRNFARQSSRGADRRAAREALVARPEAQPSAHDLVARAAQQRQLVQAVIELDEPYRTTLLMRFFEDMPPRAIARQLGVPVETVRTRIQRGLARLRAELDRAHGGNRNAWVGALLPVAVRPFGIASSAVGTLLMKVHVQLGIALLSVAGVFAAWYALNRDATTTTTLAAQAQGELQAAPAAPSDERAAPLGESEPRAPAEAAAVKSAATAPETTALPASAPRIRGRVVDDLARAVSGVEVALRSGKTTLATDPRATSGTDGRFDMAAVKLEKGRLVVADKHLTTVLAGVIGQGPGTSEPIVVVAPRLFLSGHVIDEAGLSIEGARLSVDLPDDLRTRVSLVLDYSENESWVCEADDRGFFDFDSVPKIEGATLRAVMDGFEPYFAPLPAGSDANMMITLRRPPAADGVVRGRVVDPSGQPVDGARVAFGLDSMRTDEQGAFAFRADAAKEFNFRFKQPPSSLVAVKQGYLPARFEPPKDGQRLVWPSTVTLRLGETPLSIAGRVVDDRREPIPGARVWLEDATFFGRGDNGPLQVESILAGDERSYWHFVEADDSGAFEIEGLLPREYRLRAMDPKTLLRCEEGPFQAGTNGVQLRLATDTLYPRVAGRVVGADGQPVADVQIFPMCDAFQARLEGKILGTSHHALDGVTTDAEGRFELVNVPRTLVYLRIEGEPILPLEYCRYVEGDERFTNTPRELPKDRIEKLEIVVARRCHLQLELADATLADELAILDADGDKLELSIIAGNSRREGFRQPILEGRSHVVAVPDTGKTLVLYRNKAEVSRMPLKLTPGEVKQIQL